MKQLLSFFLVLMLVLFALTACGCDHEDKDDNGLCDKCGEDYEDGKDLPDTSVCEHKDENKDHACDNGCGKTFGTCEDANIDGYCDYGCGKEFSIVYSKGLIFTSNGDGTCYVSGIGRCKDTNLRIPSVSPQDDVVITIGDSAFDDCKSLTSVTIPDSVTSIYSHAFSNCTGLTSVTVGNSVASIGNYAFKGCTNLTSVVIPDSVTSIYSHAFYNCTGLTSVYITDIEKWCSISFHDASANPLYYAHDLYLNEEPITHLVIPDSVTSIGEYAFYNCTGLTSVTIPDFVTSIGKSAFHYCTGLTNVAIGNRVQSIGEWAFNNCTGLTSVTIGNSVESIGNCAFYNCYKLVEVINLSSLNIQTGASNYGSVAEHAIEVHTRESMIDNQDDYLFYTYKDVHYLLGYIGDDTDITLPKNYNGESYEIYETAFYDCYNLTSIVVPDGVTSISSYAFYNCDSLTSIVIPDSVTSIGSYAFYNCNNLTSIVVPDGVTSIGSYAFYTCASLTSIVIPDGVTSISEGAFQSCYRLTSVVIPDSVTSIGKEAFAACHDLTSVYYKGDATEWSAISISSVYNSDLQNATRYYYCESAPTRIGNYWHYDANGEIEVWP